MKSSPSSSEGALTSLRGLDLPLNRGGTANSRRSNGVGNAPPTLDSFLANLGDPGRFQIVVMVLLATNCIPVVVNHLLMAFYAVRTPHNCRVPDDFIGNKSSLLPPGESKFGFAQCEMYVDADNHSLGTTACIHGYEFHFEDDKEWNIVAEWGLVCDRSFVASLVTTVYFCGVMIGGVIFGSLSDRFGRKNMMLVCLYTQCVIGIGIHFVRRLIVFIGLRFVQGVFIQGLQCVTFSMVMELFSPQYRTLAGCVVEAFWAAGIILLALIAKYVQHWRYIQLAVNIPTIATVFYIWIIPESVRWLMSKGKLKRAEEIVIRIASYNSLRLDRSWLREEMQDVARVLHLQQRDMRDNPDIRDILKNKVIRRNAFVMFFIWFSVNMSYYGISYSIPNLSGDRYLNFMIGGGIELGAYLLAYVVLNGIGRKYPLMVYLFLSGVFCIGTVTVKQYVPADLVDVDALVIGLALVGKAAVVSCFCSIFIYSSELFPTVIRTVGVGSCTFFGRVGALSAPQLLLLGGFLYEHAPQLVTFLTFGALSFTASFLTLFLPETMNKGLPDTVLQANDLVQGSRKRSSLVRGRNGASDDSMDEVGYGKSPEWVEVDGMIVSRGVLESNGADTLSRGGTLGKVKNVTAGMAVGEGGGGSTLSLPYSSRTLLTNSSTRSAVYGVRQILPEEDGSFSQPPSSSSENAYETLPVHHGQSAEAAAAPPLPPVPQPRGPGRQQQHLVQLNRPSAEAGCNEISAVDDSVISAHVVSMTSKGLFKDKILLSSDLGDETRL